MHLLVVNRGEDRRSPEGHQVHGFRMYEKGLREKLGLSVEMARAETLDDIGRAVEGRPCDLALVMVSWREKPDDVIATFRRLSERPDRPRIAFLDYFAPASSPYLGALPFVDCYVKRQAYRDPAMNNRHFEGGNLFTDHVVNRLGIDIKGWQFGSEPDPDHLGKLIHGWNLGVSPLYRRLLRLSRSSPLAWEHRPFALSCRMGLSEEPSADEEWYHRYRRICLEALGPIRRDFHCTGSSRVRPIRYLSELMFCQIGFSPFGWGEVCFRDYEVIACGGLLVKPSMEHLDTSPSIYIPGKTYVPVAWDLSDLDEVIRHYLSHPSEAKQIVRDAQRTLLDYFEKDGFVDDIRRVIAHCGFTSDASSARPGLVSMTA